MSHCDARVPVEVKNFLSQKIFQLFFKTCLLHVSGLWDNLKQKKFSNPSPDIAMRFERQKLPLTCNQRRRTLPVRITDHMETGLELGPRVSHCDARVPVEVKNFLIQKIFQLFFKTCLLHVSGLWDNLKQKKNFPNFRPIRVPITQ